MKNIELFGKRLFRILLTASFFSSVFFAGCKQNNEENKPSIKIETDKFKINFSVDGSGGLIKAEIDGAQIVSGVEAEKGKTVFFKAEPIDGKYQVEKWYGVTEVLSDKKNAKLIVNSNVNVKVKFKKIEIKLPEDFISVPVPDSGIEGIDPSYPIPENTSRWKGVFIEGRKVKLSPYALGKYAVTYELWVKVRSWAEKNGYKFKNLGLEGGFGEQGAVPIKENYPVTEVSWHDCIVWCNAYTAMKNGNENECVYFKKDKTSLLKDATEKEGENIVCDTAFADMSKNGFRLPTEAEWEFAARYQSSDNTNAVNYEGFWLTKLNSASGAKKPTGFENFILPSGESWQSLRDETSRVAVYDLWWNGKAYVAQVPKTSEPGKVNGKAPNSLGIYNMSGNVWEWCFDLYDKDASISDGLYRKDGFIINPQGAAGGNQRVTKGSSWKGDADYTAVGLREKWDPRSRMKGILGFRLACSIR